MGIRRALLVTDRFLYDSGAAARVGQVLSDAGVEYAVYYNVQPNPTVQVVNDCIAAARTLQVQLLVALGGGSAIDTAKAASIVVACGGTVEQYEGENKSSKPGLPIVAVNTTAGTGSECTSFYIVTDPVRHSKMAMVDPNCMVSIAVNDTDFMSSMPPKLTAATGMDALTHAIEAYVSTAGSMFTDANALHAIREIVEWLPKSYQGDKEARQHMHEAQCIAGIAFSSGLLGIVHSMAHKTGAAFTGDHIIHGCANAMYLGKVIQFNAKDARAKSRYAYIAKEVLHLAGETEDELVAALVQEIRDLNDKLDIPQGIKNYGKGGVKADESIIDYAEFEEKKSRIAVDAIGDACTGSNPRTPTPEEMEKLLECVYNDVDVDF